MKIAGEQRGIQWELHQLLCDEVFQVPVRWEPRHGLGNRNHTLGLVASGSSTVTLSAYVDGVLKRTMTNSFSPFTVDGLGLLGDGTPADSTLNEWQDYSGSSPSSSITYSPGTVTSGPVRTPTVGAKTPIMVVE
jgi:hypothetical protein